MKTKISFSLMFFVGILFTHCDKDDPLSTTCDSDGGVAINDQIGRIYKETRSDPNFFYLGNADLSKKGGGYIPCNGLSAEFQSDGLAVVYSGIDKGALPETGDPNFAFIKLTKIEKAK